MRNNRDAALDYAQQGYCVFPIHSPVAGRKCDCHLGDGCTSPAKHPRTQHGLADATADLMKVARWWETWPAANIGVATGPQSGLVVLDVDPRHGGDAELRGLVEENELLPAGPAYETGSGGSHYWFRHPGFKVTSRPLSEMSGLDVKGDGGYVIVPPSVHSTGGSYTWYDDSDVHDPLPEIPAWLLERMQRGDSGYGHAAELPEDVVTGRNNTLASLGGTLRRRGLSEQAIFKLLMALNATWSNPLDAREVAKIAASMARYEPTPDGEIIIDTPVQRARKNGSAPPPYQPQPYSAADLMRRDLPDVRMVVPELIPEGLAILAGKPKLGKSFMSFNFGIAIAQGGIVMGQIGVDEGEVLILALEDNERRLKKRLAGLLGEERPPERLWFETRWPREDEGGGNLLDAWLGTHPGCRFVVIDTLAKFRPKGVEGKYSEDYASIEGLQEMAGKHGIAILLITHYRKAFSEDWLDNVTGTLGIAGAADTILGLERPRGGAGQASAILHVTGRDVGEKDLALKVDGLTGQWVILGDADEYQMGIETAKLMEVLKENGAPMKVNEIASRLGKKRNTTSHLCARAASEGMIRSFGGGLYGLGGGMSRMSPLSPQLDFESGGP